MHTPYFLPVFCYFVEEVPFLKAEPKRARFEGMDTSLPQESIAILIRNKSDINTIKEVFGDVGLGINPVTSRDPASMKDFLLLQSTPMRSCFIIVESKTKRGTADEIKQYCSV